ncbi:MAG: alginate export family protein [Planctomycetia bacterium]|nr:alginate export family protein [Planctomycetia bacterium]
MGRKPWESVRRPFVWTALAWLLATSASWGQEGLELPAIAEPAEKPVTAAPAEGKADSAAPADAKDADKAPECPNPWAKVPPVRVIPPAGNFSNAPTDPGYYSVVDWLRHEYREKPPRFLYSSLFVIPYSFFDADFRYLDDPKTPPKNFLEEIHRVHLGDCWLFNTGGQVWWRHMHEINSRLTGVTNDYDLVRTRAFMDLWYKDQFRFFLEYIDAHTFNQDLPPAPIDVNRSDFLNLFVEAKIAEIDEKPVYARVGRQELLFGSQRSISPLDWAATRRTFQGVRAYRPGEKWDFDAFWVKPILVNPSRIDSWDEERNFVGLWATHRPKAGHFHDFYLLWLEDRSPTPNLQDPVAVPYNVYTGGTRLCGKEDQWLWDHEFMLQLGDRSGQTIVAGAATVSGGYHFKDAPLNPTLWLCYDFASGSQNRDGETFNTFNQLFPFGHYYLGWLDLVGRQNIHDVNAHLFLYPTNWWFVWLQFHHFELASARDALFNTAGVPLRFDPSGWAGRQVGNEIDIVINFHLCQHANILVGYSHLYAGDFIRDTAPTPAAARDPELFYLLVDFRW